MALFVIAVRCLSGWPFALTCAAPRAEVGVERICPASEPSVDQGPLALLGIDDDSDADDLDPFLAPSFLELGLHSPGEVSDLPCGAIADRGPFAEHASGPERPPRV
jgi:hypothetical protein